MNSRYGRVARSRIAQFKKTARGRGQDTAAKKVTGEKVTAEKVTAKKSRRPKKPP